MARKEKKYHFVYKTTNLLTGKYYIGMHSTNDLNDGYLGSGKYLKRSIKKNKKENFKIEKIEFFENRKELIKGEKKIVTPELLKDPLCMNLREGGGGSIEGVEHSEDYKLRMSLHSSKTFAERVGVERAKEWSENISKALIKYNNEVGVSDETRKKLSESHKGQKAWNSGKKTGLIPWNKGVSGSMKGKGCGVKKGVIPWNKGISNNKVWIFNEALKETKQISPKELENFVSLGWKKGRKIKW